MKRDRIEGKQPVREALRSNRRRIHHLQISQRVSRSDVEDLLQEAARQEIEVSWVRESTVQKQSRIDSHQGVVAICEPFRYGSVEEVLSRANREGVPPMILVAAHIQDPQNLGALIRTAEVAGAHGVIIPRRRAAGVTSAVVKASAGATEHMPVVRVTNLVRTVKQLKDRRIWFYGGDVEGRCLYDVRLDGAVGLCVGSEGTGLPRLLKETCDGLVRIPQKGQIESLNVSVAGAVLMYEVVRRRMG